MTTNPSPPDWRGLCEELTEHLALLDEPPHELVCRAQEALSQPEPGCGYPSCVDDSPDERCHRWLSGDCAGPDAARAALAAEADGPAVPEGREPASVVGEPSDEDLLEIARTVDLLMEDGSTGYLDFADVSHLVAAFARAVLARYGHQPAPPAAGEAAELVAWLRLTGEGQPRLSDEGYARLTRAADLLEQRHPAPVPVSERLPELRGMFERILCVARSSGQRPVGNIQLADRLISAVVSWAALPLPQGEVEQ